MLISQGQNIHQFVMTHLTDVVDPARHFRDDPDRSTTGDQAFAVIRTPFNAYNLSCASAYVTPPAGAPAECKQLGTVTFHHHASGQRIVGPKSDKTWRDISDVIHKAEYADAIAGAKGALAEAAPHEVADRRAKLTELAGRAKKWGIDAKLPVFPNDPGGPGLVHPSEAAFRPFDVAQVAGLPQHHGIPIRTVADVSVEAPKPETREELRQIFVANPNAIAPYIGAPIVYVTNPGEQISGMGEIPGHVVKVHSPDRVTVYITPDTSEPKYLTNLPRRGSDAGNGRVHKHNCWDFSQEWLAERERIAELERSVAQIRKVSDIEKSVWRDIADGLVNRVIALEAAAKEKPRRGRPPKHEAADEAIKEATKPDHFIATGSYGEAEAVEVSSAPEEAEVEGAELASELDPADAAHPLASETDRAA